MDKVSIIVPTYNRAEQIVECLNSIISQTYQNIEVIVVNDGSKDNTSQILKSYIKAHSDTYILYLEQENKGAPAARNLGLQNATGRFVVFFDSDDTMHKNRIMEQVNSIINNEGNCSVCGYYNIQKKISWIPKKKYKRYINDLITRRLLWSTQIWMYERESLLKIGGYDEHLPCFQDLDLTFRYLWNISARLCIVAEPLTYFNNRDAADRIMNIMQSHRGFEAKKRVYHKIIYLLMKSGSLYLLNFLKRYAVFIVYLKKTNEKKIYSETIDFFYSELDHYTYIFRTSIKLLLNIYIILYRAKLFLKNNGSINLARV